MRPNNLIIKGFGSYARETVIPFDDLGDGLYLITGDTGAKQQSLTLSCSSFTGRSAATTARSI